MDCIRIKNLEIYCYHGVLPEENVLGQKFLVSLDLYTDIRTVGRTDEIKDSINYAEVAHFVKQYFKDHTYKLIEAAAENLAAGVLLKYPKLTAVTLELKKPWAPILLPLETVSVKIRRHWHEVYLSIGSNMGDKAGHLDRAISLLHGEPECKDVTVSDYMVTKPECEVEQEDFLNAAVRLWTLLSPEVLLQRLQEMEEELGRVRTIRHGPRTIDLDVVFYDDLVLRTDELTIPHREMHNRYFVLAPMSHIAPEKEHPIYKKNVMQLLEKWKESHGPIGQP